MCEKGFLALSHLASWLCSWTGACTAVAWSLHSICACIFVFTYVYVDPLHLQVKWLDWGLSSQQCAVKLQAEQLARSVLAKHVSGCAHVVHTRGVYVPANKHTALFAIKL